MPAALGMAVLALGGCAPVLVAAGAGVGYAVSRDSVTLDMDHPQDRVWTAIVEETHDTGKIKREDANRQRMDLRVDGTDVVITLQPLTPSTVRVSVRARRFLLPRPEMAQRVAFGIQRRVERTNRIF